MGLLKFLGDVATGYEEGKAVGEAKALLGQNSISARGGLIHRIVTCSGTQLDLFDAALVYWAQHSLTPWGRRHAAELLNDFRSLRG